MDPALRSLHTVPSPALPVPKMWRESMGPTEGHTLFLDLALGPVLLAQMARCLLEDLHGSLLRPSKGELQLQWIFYKLKATSVQGKARAQACGWGAPCLHVRSLTVWTRALGKRKEEKRVGKGRGPSLPAKPPETLTPKALRVLNSNLAFQVARKESHF